MTTRFPSSVRFAIADEYLYVPEALLSASGWQRLRDRLTIRPFMFDSDEPQVTIQCCTEQREGYFGLPLAWGLLWLRQNYPEIEVENRISLGSPAVFLSEPDPNHENVEKPVAQAGLMRDMLARARTHSTMLVKAPTGTGKTACALYVAGKLERTTLVLVHLDHQVEHWTRHAQDMLGVPTVGLVQESTEDWEGHPLTVAMMPTLFRREYAPEFYRAFGTVIIDEVHRCGAPVFSRCVPMFSAAVKIGMTATPSRRDGGDKVVTYHLGEVSVESSTAALHATCHVLTYRADEDAYWGNSPGAVAMCLSRMTRRNQLIVKAIRRLHALDRTVLVVSSRIEHLEALMLSCESVGIPTDHMGQYTRQRTVDKEVVRNGITFREKTRTNVGRAELAKVKAQARILFATYGMVTESFDMPRLDAGIDALPRASGEQLIGRIRRPAPGKREPLWVTIRDIHDPKLEGYYARRINEYSRSNVEVVEHG